MAQTQTTSDAAARLRARLDRPSDFGPPDTRGPVLDLRPRDGSAARDRSAHRRAAWLYEDLLN